jgi:hypothetical protein
MDIETKAIEIFNKFIKDLSKTFPEIKNSLYRNYEKELTSENIQNLDEYPKFKNFLKIIEDNNKLIQDKDDSFFKKDFQLLEEINFDRLWTKNISDKTKSSIWKYFQSFSLITINLNSSAQLQEFLSNNDTKIDKDNKEVIKELKNIKKIENNIKNDTNESTDNSEITNTIESLLNSTEIGGIAKEVSKSLNLDQLSNCENEQELFQNFLNPENMSNMFKSINSIMETKMKDGKIDPNKLQKEAELVQNQVSQLPMMDQFSSIDPSKFTPPAAAAPKNNKKKKKKNKK